MNRRFLLPFSAFALMAMVSCGGNAGDNVTDSEKTSEKATEEVSSQENCHFIYKEGSATVGWTAFKTTSKVPVGGKFTQVKVRGENNTHGLTGLLETIEFSIATSSTSTNDTIRDGKIVASFFGKMVSTDAITGSVKSATGDDKSGTCTFLLKMNNVEQELPLEYVLANDTLTLTGEMDILDFQANDAMSELNKACKDLHMGSDGVSKTWTTVDLNIQAALGKDCH